MELGFTLAAGPRDFLFRWRAGAFLHPEAFDPGLGAPYRMVGWDRTDEGGILLYEDWARLGRENARLSQPDLPNYGNSCAFWARAALVCAIDAEFPGARETLAGLESLLPDPRRVMVENPS